MLDISFKNKIIKEQIMQKRLKHMPVISLFLAISALTGCGSNAQMPKVKGKEVNFTNKELERKLERLNFTLPDDKIIESNGKLSAKEIYDEDSFAATTTIKTTRNLRNSDLWFDQTYEQKINEGTLKATISAFESNRYTYFDIDRNSNEKYDGEYDDLNFNIYNGKYFIEKGYFGSYDLEDVLNFYSIGFIDPNFATIFEYISLDLFLDLNYYNFNKLKFYENDEFFSISLKTDYKSIKSERSEIFDVFDDYVGFPDEEVIKGFKYEIVLVFERNKISAAGLNILIEAEEEDDGEYYYVKNEYDFACKYVEKLPKEITYSQYSLIEDLEEIIR